MSGKCPIVIVTKLTMMLFFWSSCPNPLGDQFQLLRRELPEVRRLSGLFLNEQAVFGIARDNHRAILAACHGRCIGCQV